LELELFATAFGWRSWTATMRAAKITIPKTPAASHQVSRLNRLITSLVTGALPCVRISIF
jgi:hypothetical protein